VLARKKSEGMTGFALIRSAGLPPAYDSRQGCGIQMKWNANSSENVQSRSQTGAPFALYLAIILVFMCAMAQAQVTYTVTTTDDAFLATGSPDNSVGTNLTADNFGGAGVLAISPPGANEGEFQSVLKFDLSGATNLFDETYGTNWIIGTISLDFASNVGTEGAQPMNGGFNIVNGGNFVIEWLADDGWVEGTGRPMAPTMDGVTYDSLSNLLAETHVPLCTNTYVPPGNNVHVTWPLPLNPDLVTNILAGGPVAFRLYAADNVVGYVFNSHNFGNGNQPFIHVTAVPLPLLYSGGFTNGMFCLNGFGNSTYTVQACSDLSSTNWQTIGNVTANGTGVLQFSDTNSSMGAGLRFYRFSQ
jgi:hypothetical protein